MIDERLASLTRLNLGCGYDRRPGYLNIDVHAFLNPDLVADVRYLHMLPGAAYDEIIAQDVLEHFRWSETPLALFEWNRLLKKQASLFIRTTYVVGATKRFLYQRYQDIQLQKLLIINLFSQQSMEGDYHLTAFSERLIRYYLWETGFEIDNITLRDEWLFEIYAHKVIEYYDQLLTCWKHDSNSHFIREVYRSILGREPDAAGLCAWTERLSQGEIDRQAFINISLLSEERETMMASKCPDFDLIFDKPS